MSSNRYKKRSNCNGTEKLIRECPLQARGLETIRKLVGKGASTLEKSHLIKEQTHGKRERKRRGI